MVMVLPRKILFTTSRNPTPRIRTFCHDLARIIPNTAYANRGKMSNDEIAEKALESNADRVAVVERSQGGSGVLRFFRTGKSGLVQTRVVIHAVDIKLQRNLGVARVKPVVSISVEESKESRNLFRLAHTLSDFLGVPVLRQKEAFGSKSTTLSVSHDTSGMIVMTFIAEPCHFEVGPRMLISRVEW